MDYKCEKGLEDLLVQVKSQDLYKYYELLLLKEIYDKLNINYKKYSVGDASITEITSVSGDCNIEL